MKDINWIEVFGTLSAIVVLISMCFKTYTFKGNVYMRVFNMIGSLMYVIYGLIIKSTGVVVLNGPLVFINLYYLYKAFEYEKGGKKAFEKSQARRRKAFKQRSKKRKVK